ncbi:MAG TPA: hypothetical protein VFF49_05560 [Thermodesulfobacteriota bacterium]|nr:hypothetical protein [Thermodesulfobacteriota bacterium]
MLPPRVLHVQDTDFTGWTGDSIDKLDRLLARGTPCAEHFNFTFVTHIVITYFHIDYNGQCVLHPVCNSVYCLLLDHLFTTAAARCQVTTLAGCGALCHRDFTSTVRVGTFVNFTFFEGHLI